MYAYILVIHVTLIIYLHVCLYTCHTCNIDDISLATWIFIKFYFYVVIPYNVMTWYTVNSATIAKSLSL